jgi:hypothetical protein
MSAAKSKSAADSPDREMIITRVVNTPREGGKQTLARLDRYMSEHPVL